MSRRPLSFLLVAMLVPAAACFNSQNAPADPPRAPDDLDREELATDDSRDGDSRGGESEPAPAGTPVAWETSSLVTDLAAPWDLTLTPNNRIFLTERDSGRISEHLGGRTRGRRQLPVDNASEGGLLGIAHSPNFVQDNLLYVYYTADKDNRIVRFDPDTPAEPELVFEGIPKSRIHNGGRIDFGPDGMLYVGTGDAARPDLAQDPDSLAGKILRMTPDGDLPEDNPTAGSFVYSMGHRNVQGLAWDSKGRLFATEFGPDENDEVNRILPGHNYGWPEVTGQANRKGFTDPIFVKDPREASWSGLTASVRGAIPQWEDNLLIASLRGQRLWRLELNDEGTEVVDSEALFVGEWGRLRTAVQAGDGSIWVLSNNRDGRGSPREHDDQLYRIGPATADPLRCGDFEPEPR
ncbi:PQQ-dependent sugar dehydrogenase [Lujinxingia sediminis]|uniref:PQQ-dependent sugar dehydrogenase n=1 Tax=Lujinxingia sediminis TaxID=2480984 RepID=A0ABY0CTD5_9DELT|nr:PQQ-dependent sugar dehydrogenase [Lujinxingia sediminis]RVU44866.1 PQQ-dependent sugar dehydrogenase [Lujinxingia sediminis]